MDVARRLSTDVLIVGAGAAGCRAALGVAEAGASCALLNKGPVARSGITMTAGGVMGAPFHPDDSEDLFYQDTVKFGHYLGDQNLIEMHAASARQRILDLDRYGVAFRKRSDGSFHQGRPPGPTVPRNVILRHEGYGIIAGLRRAVLARPTIDLVEDAAVLALLEDAEGRVAGGLALDLKTGELIHLEARATIVATGGAEALWKITDCPAGATGDGMVAAYRAGAKLVDLEMVLFYPSVVIWPPAAQGCFVAYEALAVEGCDGNIRDAYGVPVLPKPLPVRDVAMRLMWEAIEAGRGTPRGGLWWDVTQSPKGYEAVNGMLQSQHYRYLREKLGRDPSTQKIEVAPGAHYPLGGIYIDENCETGAAGLYAACEAAGNFEGANRLAGSALTGTQTFAARAAEAAVAFAAASGAPGAVRSALDEATGAVARFVGRPPHGDGPLRLKRHLQELVWQSLGLRRSAEGLRELQSACAAMRAELEKVRVPGTGAYNLALLETFELAGMIDLAEYTAGAALLREESRGHHRRVDFPGRDAQWLKHTIVQDVGGRPAYTSAPVVVTRMPLPGA